MSKVKTMKEVVDWYSAREKLLRRDLMKFVLGWFFQAMGVCGFVIGLTVLVYSTTTEQTTEQVWNMALNLALIVLVILWFGFIFEFYIFVSVADMKLQEATTYWEEEEDEEDQDLYGAQNSNTYLPVAKDLPV